MSGVKITILPPDFRGGSWCWTAQSADESWSSGGEAGTAEEARAEAEEAADSMTQELAQRLTYMYPPDEGVISRLLKRQRGRES